MASKNSRKQYLEDSFYHIYNRGVEKRDIFQDQQDFNVFISYLRTYLLPKDTILLHGIIQSDSSSQLEKERARRELALNNFTDEIELLCFALLPNHFHFLIKQHKENSMDRFINSLGTRYSAYFNRKYHRVGTLYQGVYKAVIVESDDQFLHLSRYIHLNPFNRLNFPLKRWPELLLPSSVGDYLSIKGRDWIKTDYVLSQFTKKNNDTYFHFMESYCDPEIIAPIGLDYDEE